MALHSDPVEAMVDANFLLTFILGAIITLINTPMLIYVFTNPRLRKQKEVVIVCFVVVADLSNAVAVVCLSIYQIPVIESGRSTAMITNLGCARVVSGYVFILAYQFMGASTITVTLDRAIAVIRPFRYRSFTWSYAYLLVGGGVLYSFIGLGVCVYAWWTGPELKATIMCFTDSSYNPDIWHYMLYFRQFSIAISIVAYVPIAARVNYLRKKEFSLTAINGVGSQSHKRLVRTTLLIGITLLCEIIFIALPDIILNFNVFGLAQYAAAWYVIIISKGLVNVFLYTFSHEELKRVLLNIIPGRRKQPVNGRTSSVAPSVLVSPSPRAKHSLSTLNSVGTTHTVI